MRFTRGLALCFCVGLLMLGGSCVAEVDSDAEIDSDDEPVEAAEQALGPPPFVCVDTFTCGGCCGNSHQIDAFIACCERGDGFACAGRFGCK